MAKQSLHQSLQQKLSPQQIQLMKLIELSTLEIEQKVKDELEGNPALDDENLSMDDFDKHEDDVVSVDDSQRDQDFDIDQITSISLTGGNGNGCVLQPILGTRNRELLFDSRDEAKSGYSIKWEAPIMRHFTVELEKI